VLKNETGFSEENVRAICGINLSNKKKRPGGGVSPDSWYLSLARCCLL
jgi:hypothetical protein